VILSPDFVNIVSLPLVLNRDSYEAPKLWDSHLLLSRRRLDRAGGTLSVRPECETQKPVQTELPISGWQHERSATYCVRP